jgi:hypothetical protein
VGALRSSTTSPRLEHRLRRRWPPSDRAHQFDAAPDVRVQAHALRMRCTWQPAMRHSARESDFIGIRTREAAALMPWFAIAARLGAEVSNPSPCSSRHRPKHSPPFSGALKRPTTAGFCASGLCVRDRNERPNLSPTGDLSPKLGAWPIYSTSFFASSFSGLTSLTRRNVGIPFACCL